MYSRKITCPKYFNSRWLIQLSLLMYVIVVNTEARKSKVSDAELQDLSEELFALDKTSYDRPIELELQGKIPKKSEDYQEDYSPKRLFKIFPDVRVINSKTFRNMIKLHDNNEPDSSKPEHLTAAELAEENEFIDSVLETKIMQSAYLFLVEKDMVQPNLSFRDLLHGIWFGLYNRSNSSSNPNPPILTSSGFEHVFLGEVKKRRGVSGFHNWVFFSDQERRNNLNYQGYYAVVDFGNQKKLIEHRFNWLGKRKPISSMFIGTSPELELALYSVCWFSRPNQKCPVSFNGKRINIQTYVTNFKGKKYVGSAFPMLVKEKAVDVEVESSTLSTQ